MRSKEKLLESYEIQKKIFEEAEKRRLENVSKQLNQLREKRDSLNSKIGELELRLNTPREFESFDFFLSKITAQSNKPTNQTNLFSSDN